MAAGLLMAFLGACIIGWMTIGGRARWLADQVMPA